MAQKFFSLDKESLKNKDSTSDSPEALAPDASESNLEKEVELPPVVARMVVEIRSDGTRTVARGALEDLQTGERVSLQANAKNPLALAQELTKSLLLTPTLASSFAKQAARELIPRSLRSKIAKKFKNSKSKKDQNHSDPEDQ